jgi:hypothetical protein
MYVQSLDRLARRNKQYYQIVGESKKHKYLSSKEGGEGKAIYKDIDIIGSLESLKRFAAENPDNKLDFKDMPLMHQHGVGAALREIFALLIITTLGSLDWDDKDEPAYKNLWQASKALLNMMLLRSYGDILGMWDSNNWMYLADGISPALSLIPKVIVFLDAVKKLGTAMGQEFILGDEDEPFSDKTNAELYYQRDTKTASEGDLKIWNKLVGVMPAGQLVKYSMEKYELYRQDKNNNKVIKRQRNN